MNDNEQYYTRWCNIVQRWHSFGSTAKAIPHQSVDKINVFWAGIKVYYTVQRQTAVTAYS